MENIALVINEWQKILSFIISTIIIIINIVVIMIQRMTYELQQVSYFLLLFWLL